VLTLTATPIPRTLQMSLLGIRDLSVIETPPIDRLAIRTYVTRYDESLIREAILRELGRDGQVFFVHNRVETIEIRARRLRELVPDAVVTVAHGQMHERDLEHVMRLLRQEDPRPGVFRHHRIGARYSQRQHHHHRSRRSLRAGELYQCAAGSAGRTERAYAYLMIRANSSSRRGAAACCAHCRNWTISAAASGWRHMTSRFAAPATCSASTVRHIAAVDSNCTEQMMERQCGELKGEPVAAEVEPEISLGFRRTFPTATSPTKTSRLVFYRRLAVIRGQADLDQSPPRCASAMAPFHRWPTVSARHGSAPQPQRLPGGARGAARRHRHTAISHGREVDVQRLLTLVRKGNGRSHSPPTSSFSSARGHDWGWLGGRDQAVCATCRDMLSA